MEAIVPSPLEEMRWAATFPTGNNPLCRPLALPLELPRVGLSDEHSPSQREADPDEPADSGIPVSLFLLIISAGRLAVRRTDFPVLLDVIVPVPLSTKTRHSGGVLPPESSLQSHRPNHFEQSVPAPIIMENDASEPSTFGIKPPGYRLPAATRLGTVRLQVSDLTQSLGFYEDLLGLRVLDRPDGRTVLGPEANGMPLVELVEHPGARPVPPGGRPGLYHIAFLLPTRTDLARFATHLLENDIEPGMSDHRVSEALYLSDPDGLGIEVYADRPRETWDHDGRQLALATDPLDVDDLLQKAGAPSWTGAPPDTVVGHVHLHVGDLSQATAFYHEALGLDKTVWSYPGALFLSAGGYHHHLGTNTWATGTAPPDADDAQLLEWSLVVPTQEDVAETARSLDKAGYALTHDDEACLVEDPWGTSLRITRAPRQK